jgi:hypothetical protein
MEIKPPAVILLSAEVDSTLQVATIHLPLVEVQIEELLATRPLEAILRWWAGFAILLVTRTGMTILLGDSQ